MKKKTRIGCLAVALYCIGCSLLAAISGQGLFLFIAEIGTLRGGDIPGRDRIALRGIDIATAPLQVAILAPMAAVNYIQEHTGERGRELAEAKQKESAYRHYLKMLDEDFDRIYDDPGFLDPANRPAMKALDIWIRPHAFSGEFDAERKRRFAEYCLEHPELMPPLREFWRHVKLPEDLQRRALGVALETVEKNPGEEAKLLLWGLMNVCLENGSPGLEITYTFPDEMLQDIATNPCEAISWCAQQALENRGSYRNYLRQINGKR